MKMTVKALAILLACLSTPTSAWRAGGRINNGRVVVRQPSQQRIIVPLSAPSPVQTAPSAISYPRTLTKTNRFQNLIGIMRRPRSSGFNDSPPLGRPTVESAEFARYIEMQAQRYFDRGLSNERYAGWVISTLQAAQKQNYKFDINSYKLIQGLTQNAQLRRSGIDDVLATLDIMRAAGANVKAMTTKLPLEKMFEMLKLGLRRNVRGETLMAIASVTEDRLARVLSNESVRMMSRMTRQRIQLPLYEFTGKNYYRYGDVMKIVKFALSDREWKALGVATRPEDVQVRQFEEWDRRFATSLANMDCFGH